MKIQTPRMTTESIPETDSIDPAELKRTTKISNRLPHRAKWTYAARVAVVGNAEALRVGETAVGSAEASGSTDPGPSEPPPPTGDERIGFAAVSVDDVVVVLLGAGPPIAIALYAANLQPKSSISPWFCFRRKLAVIDGGASTKGLTSWDR